MDELDNLISKIEESECLARETASALLSHQETTDYASARTLLTVSEELRNTIDSLRKLPAAANVHVKNTAISNLNSESSELFPVFFVDGQDVLFKVGKREQPTERNPYWWKNVAMSESMDIMQAIARWGELPFKKEDVLSKLPKPIPVYRIDIVVTALKASGFLDSPRRGLYRILHGTPKEWSDALRQLPKRNDLVIHGR